MRHLIPALFLIGLVALVLAPNGAEAGSDFDGLWRGKAHLNCGAHGKMEFRVEDGKIVGKARFTGFLRGDFRIQGRLTDSGNIREGRAIGATIFGVTGGFRNEKGRGMLEFDNCEGRWELALVERAAPVAKAPEPAPPAEDPAPARATATANDTAPPTIAVPGEIVADGPSVVLTGVIRDASTIIDVRVDGRSVSLGEDGTLRVTRAAPVGTSEMTIAALDEWGNEAKRVIAVTRAERKPPKLPPKKPTTVASTQAAPEPETVRAIDLVAEDSTPPEIDVPATLTADGETVIISGRVRDASQITSFLLNDRPVTLDPEGRFRVQRGVPQGGGAFRFAAVDAFGNQSEALVRVSRSAPTLDVAFGGFHALVIGNNDYEAMPQLRTAIADAEAIADVLAQRYGFQVTLLRNASRNDVLKALSVYRKTLGYQDNLLIYYAGHGVVDAVTERGYWLPIDAEESFTGSWISNADITDSLKAIAARHVMVIADSCYSGMLTRDVPVQLETWEDRRAWIERVVEKRSRTAFSSGGLEPVADGGGGRHSVFANALLQVLRENTRMIDAATLFLPVRKRVVLNADQTPEYADIRLAGHEGGDFVFLPQ